MTALPKLLTGEGAFANVRNVLEGIEFKQLGQRPEGAPHSIFEELWHTVYWQDLVLDWIEGGDRPAPDHAAASWPQEPAPADLREGRELVRTFLEGVNRAIAHASDAERLDTPVRGTRTVRSLLETILAHNSHHLGKIILLRQLLGNWPPPSGGDTW